MIALLVGATKAKEEENQEEKANETKRSQNGGPMEENLREIFANFWEFWNQLAWINAKQCAKQVQQTDQKARLKCSGPMPQGQSICRQLDNLFGGQMPEEEKLQLGEEEDKYRAGWKEALKIC